jgi:hypothetical protein
MVNHSQHKTSPLCSETTRTPAQKGFVRSQFVEQLVQIVFDNIEDRLVHSRATISPSGSNRKYAGSSSCPWLTRLSLSSAHGSVRLSREIASRTALGSFQPATAARARDNTHTFALALIAYLCDLRQVSLGSFGTDGPEMDECRMTFGLPRRRRDHSTTRGPIQMTATVRRPSSVSYRPRTTNAEGVG